MNKHAYRETAEGRKKDQLRNKNYKIKNKEKIKKYQDEYNKIYNAKNRKTINEKQREKGIEKRKEILMFLGGVCVVCGEIDWRCLQIDHVDGGGTKERKRFGSPGNINVYYNHIKNNPDKYQILCANHNWIKRYEQNETRRKN